MIDNPFIETGLPVALFIIMMGMGLTLTLRDFRNVLVYPRAMLLGCVAQILVLPALAFLMVYPLQLSPAVAVGLVVIAACPGGTTSNVFTFLAKGNLPLSIMVTVIASFITIFTIPVFTNFAIDLYMTRDLEAPLHLPVLETIGMLFAVILLPTMLGMAIRAAKPALADQAERMVAVFGIAVLAALVAIIVWDTRGRILDLIMTAGVAAVALIMLGIALGFASGRLGRLTHADALTLAVELGNKNGTIGLMVTLTLLDTLEMAYPSAVHGVMMYAFGGWLIHYGRKKAAHLGAPAWRTG